MGTLSGALVRTLPMAGFPSQRPTGFLSPYCLCRGTAVPPLHPSLSLNPGPICVSDFSAGYGELCGVLPESQWLTEAVTHVWGVVVSVPSRPWRPRSCSPIRPSCGLGSSAGAHGGLRGVDDCSLSTFDPRCPPHRALVPGKWLLGRCSQS